MKRAFVIASLFFLPTFAFAQMPALDGYGVDPLTVTISPRYPRPFQTVTVTPKSTLIDLSASSVVVTVDGKEVGRGSGYQSYSVQTGGPGTRSAVRVSVSGGGSSAMDETVIRPTDVSLVLDPISTSHAFYEGASLVAPEGRIRVIALADLRTAPGSRIPSENLTYTWKTAGRILKAESGVGKSTLIATAPVLFRNTDVSVTVSSTDGTLVGEASVAISPTEPQLLLYQENPLEGTTFTSALSKDYSLTDSEEAFRAVPYYFPAEPSLTWLLNGKFAGSDPLITVRTAGDRAGSARLSVEAKQFGAYYSAESFLIVRFGAGNGTNLFGL